MTGGCRQVVQRNESPGSESVSLSEREKMQDESSPAQEPEPDLGSQETPMTQNGTIWLPIPPQAGESSTICPTGLLSGLKPRAHRWAVRSLVLSLVLVILILLIALIAVSAKKPEPCPAGAACPVAACPDSWIGHLGKCYYFSQAEGNWTHSQSNCSVLGASLAVIDTQQEMDFLMRYKGPSDHWIGLQRELDKPWVWTNGTEFKNWFIIAGEGPCAFLNHKDLASSGCSREGHWICSKPAEKPAGRAQ
ncbi:C-type lectin domain family 2 member D-like [Mauremys mutica]|uniref:C-type lectin domain family 2 member D-like n=1 Tax=Mauremys mutica TaxID=74926 RepID=UPI001D16E385|nr:C-type lectin domain family 2 member D-like [Mauremys mutica]